jgi:predicted nucleic acid-binding protein
MDELIFRKRILRVYVDTSVFGGVFDEEFSMASKRFFRLVQKGYFRLIVSALVRNEILDAPSHVQEFFRETMARAEIIEVNEAMLRLMRGYLDAGVVTDKWRDDALHVAQATVAGCQLIVSWNFKHIVHYQKIPLYNAVNTLQGYDSIDIYSPLEVVADEEENI